MVCKRNGLRKMERFPPGFIMEKHVYCDDYIDDYAMFYCYFLLFLSFLLLLLLLLLYTIVILLCSFLHSAFTRSGSHLQTTHGYNVVLAKRYPEFC